MKMAEYNSTHTGNQVDNFNDRISALEATIASLNTNLTNNYVLESSFNTTINGINSTINGMNATMETFATKTQVNNMSMVPSNGYFDVYFKNGSSTPSFYVSLSGGMEYRGNGNGSRDIGALIPVRKGQVIHGECVYCYPDWIRFYGVTTN